MDLENDRRQSQPFIGAHRRAAKWLTSGTADADDDMTAKGAATQKLRFGISGVDCNKFGLIIRILLFYNRNRFIGGACTRKSPFLNTPMMMMMPTRLLYILQPK